MLCDKCQRREATVHLQSFVDDVVELHDLCMECFEAEALPVQLKAIRELQARCGGAIRGGTGHQPKKLKRKGRK